MQINQDIAKIGNESLNFFIAIYLRFTPSFLERTVN